MVECGMDEWRPFTSDNVDSMKWGKSQDQTKKIELQWELIFLSVIFLTRLFIRQLFVLIMLNLWNVVRVTTKARCQPVTLSLTNTLCIIACSHWYEDSKLTVEKMLP